MKPFLDRPTLHVALILLLAVIVYGHLLVPGKVVFSPHSDFVAHGFASKQILSRSVKDGRGIPSWRSDQNSGSSAWVKPNAVYFYPTHWPFYFLSPGNAVGITYFLRFLVAALTTYLAVAAMGVGTVGRLAAAIAMLLNFKFIISLYAGWTGAESSALVPLLFAAEIYLFRKRDLMAMLFVSIVTALTLHSGHPQFMYYGALFAVGLFFIHVAQEWSCHGRRSAARLALPWVEPVSHWDSEWLRICCCLSSKSLAYSPEGTRALSFLLEEPTDSSLFAHDAPSRGLWNADRRLLPVS